MKNNVILKVEVKGCQINSVIISVNIIRRSPATGNAQ